jgi:hypothetical protein
MKKLTKEIKEITEALMYDHPALTVAEAVIIATQIQRNRVLEEAFVVGTIALADKYFQKKNPKNLFSDEN